MIPIQKLGGQWTHCMVTVWFFMHAVGTVHAIIQPPTTGLTKVIAKLLAGQGFAQACSLPSRHLLRLPALRVFY
jgi:hypothetical protein